jgi:hypothetical protein
MKYDPTCKCVFYLWWARGALSVPSALGALNTKISTTRTLGQTPAHHLENPTTPRGGILCRHVVMLLWPCSGSTSLRAVLSCCHVAPHPWSHNGSASPRGRLPCHHKHHSTSTSLRGRLMCRHVVIHIYGHKQVVHQLLLKSKGLHSKEEGLHCSISLQHAIHLLIDPSTWYT